MCPLSGMLLLLAADLECSLTDGKVSVGWETQVIYYSRKLESLLVLGLYYASVEAHPEVLVCLARVHSHSVDWETSPKSTTVTQGQANPVTLSPSSDSALQ